MNRYAIRSICAALFAVAVLLHGQQEITVNPPVMNTGTQPTADYAPTAVQAKLNVEIKDGVDTVHFIRDNSDPKIVTRAYVIKNADPYNLRGLIKRVLSSSIAGSPIGVESIKYYDGSSVLLISCDENQFKDVGTGITLDQLVEILDKKGIRNSSGTADYVYAPKYVPAATLVEMVRNSGIGRSAASKIEESWQGSSTKEENPAFTYFDSSNAGIAPFCFYAADKGLNSILFSGIGHDVNEALKFFKEVDVPLQEVQLTYKLVEIYSENDEKIGNDFQAWKATDGIDLFSAGGVYGSNWGGNGLTPNAGNSSYSYYNFNPKWSTRYLDFLTTFGKAKVVSQGTLTVANGYSADLTLKDGLFSIPATDYAEAEGDPKSSKILANVMPSDAAGEHYSRELAKMATQAKNTIIAKGDTQSTAQAADEDINNATGNYFSLNVQGGVHGNACNLSVSMLSFSVIGWDSNGAPRTTNSNYSTSIQIGSRRQEFVIGGITKDSVVDSSTGFPVLKDIPWIGWLFSTKGKSVKKSQFVLIASAEVVTTKSELSAETKSTIEKINEEH